MKAWIKLYTELPWDRKILLSAILIASLPIAATLLLNKPEGAVRNQSPAQVDTYIPKGYVLVPIEVQNYDALDSILGPYGIVDLFQGGSDSEVRKALIARNVRLLRAPQNPSHFAILVLESEATRILQTGTLFTVVVKRPGADGTQFVDKPKSIRRTIIYEGG